MARRRRKKRQRKTSDQKTANVAGRGFDFGISATAAAIGSLEFNQNLVDAQVIAVAYGYTHSNAMHSSLPIITLVGRNEAPLKSAFEEFLSWSEETDADAVDVQILFRKDGSYDFCISPEARALIDRALRYDEVFSPISMQTSWIKHIETTSKPFRDLAKHLSGAIRPFILGAATYTGLAIPGSSIEEELLTQIDFDKELVKFEIDFDDENDDQSRDDSIVRAMLRDQEKKPAPGGNRGPMPVQLVSGVRRERLRTLFPVSLWRANRDANLRRVFEAAVELGLADWQIEQSFCNLLVSQEIAGGRFHYSGISSKQWPNALIEALQSRFESADSESLDNDGFTPETICRQSILDSKYLLKAYGISKRFKSLDSVQHSLRSRGLLGNNV